MVDIQPLIETASDDSSAEEQERELRRRRKDKKKPEVKTGESTRQDDDRLERIFKAEDAAKKEQNSHSDQYEPEDDEPVRPRFFLYTEKELSKTKMKDLKTILWGKSISYADLREKKEYIARIMQRVQKDLKRMTRKELRAALEARDIPFQSTMDHAELIQQFLNG
ncbi:MAG: hypothetical protein SGCHY_002452 [Lobulomycetales sp.]